MRFSSFSTPATQQKSLALDPIAQLVQKINKLPSPSDLAKHRNGWEGVTLFHHPQGEVFQTHRHNRSPCGHLHVVLTERSFGKIYERHQKGVYLKDLNVEDWKFTTNIASLASNTFPYEEGRRDTMRPEMLKYLCPDEADLQDAHTKSSKSGGTITSDGGARRKILPPYAFFFIEFKDELGQAGNAALELFAYAVHFAANEELLKTSTVPTILLAVSGPHLIAFCFAWTGRCFQFDYLDSITLFL